jgi:hypothetical protein
MVHRRRWMNWCAAGWRRARTWSRSSPMTAPN